MVQRERKSHSPRRRMDDLLALAAGERSVGKIPSCARGTNSFCPGAARNRPVALLLSRPDRAAHSAMAAVPCTAGVFHRRRAYRCRRCHSLRRAAAPRRHVGSGAGEPFHTPRLGTDSEHSPREPLRLVGNLRLHRNRGRRLGGGGIASRQVVGRCLTWIYVSLLRRSLSAWSSRSVPVLSLRRNTRLAHGFCATLTSQD